LLDINIKSPLLQIKKLISLLRLRK